MKLLTAIFIILTTSIINAQTEKHAKIEANIFTHQNQKYISFQLIHEKGWHTYWKNPGDAGLPTKFFITIQNQPRVELPVLEWPTPKRYFESGDLLAYGYGEKPIFFALLPQDQWQQLSTSPIKAKVEIEYLICKDLCIPGKDEVLWEITRPGDSIRFLSNEGTLSQDELLKNFLTLPQMTSWPSDIEVYLSRKKENTLLLHIEVKGVSPKDISQEMNLFTPFPHSLLGFKRENLKYNETTKTLYSEFELEWDGDFETPPVSLPQDGLLKNPLKLKFLFQNTKTKKYEVIEKDISQFSLTATNLDQLTGIVSKGSTSSSTSSSSSSYLNFLIFAFLGGLILNLMPCVLPVITLKLFGLIKYQSLSRAQILKHNLIYSLGVISTFLLLALAIVLIKKSGEEVGWGFQLQSPLFVLFMVILLFVMTLNLFGLFEFRTPGGQYFGKTETKNNFLGDFLSGVLSTILSTPCSAPFLGTALTFAFTSPVEQIFLIFIFVGLGLSFPFLITGLFPQWLRFLPRPGAWMEKLKYFLGLSILITVIWLSDVFLNIVDAKLWFWPLMVLLSSIFFVFFLQKKMTFPSHYKIIFLLPVFILVFSLRSISLKPLDQSQLVIAQNQEAWKKWQPDMSQYLGKWTFIDFTAAWCLTCKVNKKLVLDTTSFEEFAKENQFNLLRGDWTKRDDDITQFLSSHGIVGVPAYFLQSPKGKMIFLGETISIGKIKKAME